MNEWRWGGKEEDVYMEKMSGPYVCVRKQIQNGKKYIKKY